MPGQSTTSRSAVSAQMKRGGGVDATKIMCLRLQQRVVTPPCAGHSGHSAEKDHADQQPFGPPREHYAVCATAVRRSVCYASNSRWKGNHATAPYLERYICDSPEC